MGDTTEEAAEVERLLQYSTSVVTRHAPVAPAVVQNEAVIRLAGYLFDMPNAGRGVTYADALRNSGARAILLPHRAHRAGSVVGAAPLPAGGGLQETGSAIVTVTMPSRWESTPADALPFPSGATFGLQVDGPDGSKTSVLLGRTQELLEPGAVVGGNASAALMGKLYAVAAVSAGGALLFTSTEAGAHTVRIFSWLTRC